jgi:hypothetical protein
MGTFTVARDRSEVVLIGDAYFHYFFTHDTGRLRYVDLNTLRQTFNNLATRHDAIEAMWKELNENGRKVMRCVLFRGEAVRVR